MKNPDEVIGAADNPYMLRKIIYRPGALHRLLGKTIAKIDRYLHRRAERLAQGPRRKGWLPSIYLHEFKRSDDDRHFHDHVGWSISIVLWSGYWEVTPDGPSLMIQELPHLVPSLKRRWRWAGPGSIRFRRATDPHFIALARAVTRDKHGNETGARPLQRALHDKPVLSLWIRGPWHREWGFYTEDGWLPWYEYVNRGPDEGYESKEP